MLTVFASWPFLSVSPPHRLGFGAFPITGHKGSEVLTGGNLAELGQSVEDSLGDIFFLFKIGNLQMNRLKALKKLGIRKENR